MRSVTPALLSVVAHAGLALFGAVMVARGLAAAPPAPPREQNYTAPPVDGPIIIDLPAAAFSRRKQGV